MLKYEETARVGDHIRSYDFAGRTDCYIEGIVQRIEKDRLDPRDFALFVVLVDNDVWRQRAASGRVGKTVYVPMETTDDYDGRVVNLSW